MLELYLIRYLLSFTQYTIYYKYINTIKIKDNYKELYNIYKTLEEYFNKYATDISLEELELFFYSQRPQLKDKDKEVYTKIFQQIRNLVITDVLISDTLKQLKQRQEAFDLSTLAYEVSQGSRSFMELITMAHSIEHEEELDKVDQSVFTTDNLEELYEGSVNQQGLRWRLGTLNRMLGSLRMGDFGFIFARPETGKTTFLASEISFFATQTDRPIIWFNNEEQGSKVMLRIYQATLGITLEELFKDIEGNKRKYHELTRGNIKIYDSGSISRNDVEKLCYQLNPACIIFDQLDKIKGFSNDRDDLKLGFIYQWARELAKQYCPVIGVSQADGTGEGKKWLTMDNVSGAKTSKQAEADFILGIGKTHDEGMEMIRHLHLSKNKLVGDRDTENELRHGRMDVIIRPEIARYLDIGEN
jgi:hypothetical protein